MAYTNKVSAVLFLAIVMAQRLADAQSEMFPKMDPKCATGMPDLLEKCFATVRVTPTEECCNDLKSATPTQVTCLCDNYIANPSFANITGPYSAKITNQCGVFDKYTCDGTSNGGDEDKEGSSSGNKTNSTGGASKNNGGAPNNNEGARNKVAASMGVFGLVASMFFVMS